MIILLDMPFRSGYSGGGKQMNVKRSTSNPETSSGQAAQPSFARLWWTRRTVKTCVSAKRTRIFQGRKHAISGCGAMRSNRNNRDDNSGSFFRFRGVLRVAVKVIWLFSAVTDRRYSRRSWRMTPALPGSVKVRCAGSTSSARLEELTTLPGAWFFGYKAGE
jgi:hypothetical protein